MSDFYYERTIDSERPERNREYFHEVPYKPPLLVVQKPSYVAHIAGATVVLVAIGIGIFGVLDNVKKDTPSRVFSPIEKEHLRQPDGSVTHDGIPSQDRSSERRQHDEVDDRLGFSVGGWISLGGSDPFGNGRVGDDQRPNHGQATGASSSNR